jgi:glycosyltransferase involved in cell wall biosynthesis
MKILFVSNLYPPNVFGGYERLCFEVASALQVKGHTITVLTSSYGEYPEQDCGHMVRRELFLFATEGNIYQPFDCSATEKARREAENRQRFDALVAEVEPDVIFVWNLYFFSTDLLKAIEASKVRKCYLLTDNWLIAQLNPRFIGSYFCEKVFGTSVGQNSVLYVLRNIYRRFSAKFHRKPHLIDGRAIFPSLFMRQLYRDAGFGFRGGEAVCYHGVKFLRAAGAQRSSRNELRGQGEVRLLFAGRVVNIKGVHTALESLRSVQKQLGGEVRVVLTIVGDTQDKPYLDELKNIISRDDIKDSVLFQEPVAEDRLFDLFQQHDIYLFPSLYEPFSLTLILALEAGIPTIASAAGGNVEIVEDRKTGLIFRTGDPIDLASKICLLASDCGLREQLSIAAASRAANLTFDNMISKIERELQAMHS